MIAASTSGTTTPPNVTFGLADDSRNTGALQSKYFSDLAVTSVRAIVEYDVYDDHRIFPGDTASPRKAFSTWYKQARTQGLEVMVSFQCHLTWPHQHCVRTAPTKRRYRREVRKFFSTYYGVTVASAWNEANSGRQPTSYPVKAFPHHQGPARAAQFTAEPQRDCNGGTPAKCAVVAGDFSDQTADPNKPPPGTKLDAYLRDYTSNLRADDGNSLPVAWGFHPYTDAAQNTTYRTNDFIGHVPTGSQVWLDEVGIHYPHDSNFDSSRPQNPDSTADATQASGVANLVDDIAASNSAITRLYYYGFFHTTLQDARIDYDLLRPTGQSPSHARAAYYQYWCRTNPGPVYRANCPQPPGAYPNGNTSGPAP